VAESAENQVHNDSGDKGEAVRGVGQLRSKPPRATKLRNGVLFLVLVVACGLLGFIMMKAKNRRRQQVEQTAVIKAGHGPATQQEKAVVDSMSRQGENVGSSHVPASFSPKSSQGRRSLLDGDAQSSDSSMPPLRYTPNAGTSGQGNQAARPLTPEELQLQKEYELEQEALHAPMVVNASAAQISSSGGQADPMQAANQALAKRLEQMGSENPDAVAKIADALLNRNRGAATADLRPGPQAVASDYDTQNKQGDKESYGVRVLSKKEADYQSEIRMPALGPYEVKSGWLIPAVLEGELDSDLPGTVRAHVRENVYDSVTGKYLLIPQGSKLIGQYNSHVGYGQKSLQAVFTRIIFPDGSSVNLESDPGVTNSGSAGFDDKADEHWKRLMGGALLTSLFSAGIEVSQGQNTSVLQTQSVGQQIGAAVGQQLGQVGAEVTRRNLNIQPTLRIRPGYRFFVSVTKDVSFPAPDFAMRTVSESK
jgi:type IV secretory pathway VirB10-like protein